MLGCLEIKVSHALSTVLSNRTLFPPQAVNLVRGLLTSHDMDPRYASTECRARVAALYLPLLGIVMDAIPQLFDPNSDDARPGAAGENGAGAGAGVLSRRSSIHEKGKPSKPFSNF